MKFHQAKHHLNKVIRPDMEIPWSADFKTTFTFKFMALLPKIFYDSAEMRKNVKNCKKYVILKWNSTTLNII